MQIDDGAETALGIDTRRAAAIRSEPEGRSALGDDGLAAGRAHAAGDVFAIAGDQHGTNSGFSRAPKNLNDHGRAADVGEGLARQARRSHPGGDDDDGVGRGGVGHWFRFSGFYGACKDRVRQLLYSLTKTTCT